MAPEDQREDDQREGQEAEFAGKRQQDGHGRYESQRTKRNEAGTPDQEQANADGDEELPERQRDKNTDGGRHRLAAEIGYERLAGQKALDEYNQQLIHAALRYGIEGGVVRLEVGADYYHDKVKSVEAENYIIPFVRLNLNLDLGDMDLTGMLEQLQSGSAQLDDGANALADGIAQVQAGIDTLNGNSGALTGGSARVRAALTQMQTALNGISASTDELNTLLDASTQIRDGIARLDEGAAQLEQQVSFEAYKAILKENGLDLDVVKDGNAKAIQQLQGMVWMMPQLKDVILLLQGSTANIVSFTVRQGTM